MRLGGKEGRPLLPSMAEVNRYLVLEEWDSRIKGKDKGGRG